MALTSLAIIDKNIDEPIYIREFNGGRTIDDGLDFEQELFGFSSPGNNIANNLWNDCSLRHQFLLQTALDRFCETTKDESRNPTGNGSDAMFVGFLCTADEFRCYGYLTTTGLKIICAIEDSILPDQKQHQKSKDSELKSVFTNIHSSYVDYLLNPFSKRNGKVSSARFNRAIDNFVNEFNATNTSVS